MRDDRALPGSAGVPLDRQMTAYRVTAPACETTDLRYFASDAFGDTFLLQFGAPEDCVEAFIAHLPVDQLAPAEVNVELFSAMSASGEFKWTFAPGGDYAQYFGEADRVRYDVVVDRGARPRTVYLIANGPG
ncbi:hypothetical protein [Dactylosporangium sp. CA-092794]|uniref:hypothetical protein n=1 Tax=Dactylosporangium sp. CA-092794 TaxID=3239929 RepID=UPI003D912738